LKGIFGCRRSESGARDPTGTRPGYGAGDAPGAVEIPGGGLIAPEAILGALKDKDRHEEKCPTKGTQNSRTNDVGEAKKGLQLTIPLPELLHEELTGS